MNTDELANRFIFHPAKTETRVEEHRRIRDLCLDMALILDEMCPDGRELSLAIARLEEVMYWANASVARQPD